MGASYSEFHDAEPIAASAAAAVLSPPADPLGMTHKAAVHGTARIDAFPSAPISYPVLAAVDVETVQLSQSICDTRFASRVASPEIEVVGVAVRDAGQAAQETPPMGDPAVLTITFSTPSMRTQQVDALVQLDLDAYPVLRIALGSGHAESTSQAPDAGAAKRRHDLVLGVAGVLIEPLLAHLSTLHFDNPCLTHIARGRIPETWRGPLVHLILSPRNADKSMGASRIALQHIVALPDRAVECIDAIVQDLPADFAFADSPIPGRLVIGAKRLSIDTLDRLQSGDVLLRALFAPLDARVLALDNASLYTGDMSSEDIPSTNVVAAWGTPGLMRLCSTARFDGISAVVTKESYMSDQLEPAFDDAGMADGQQGDPIHIGDLELPVQFEIDTLAVPLSQLSTIGPGYVIEFPVPFRDAKLRLVAHGNTIGYGELVTVGEHLGVRIVRMAHNNNASTRMDDGSTD